MFKTSDANHILLESDVFSRFLKTGDIIQLVSSISFSPTLFYSPHEKGFSVFRTNGESETDIWNHGITVYTKTAKRMGGRFELTKNHYENEGLELQLNETSLKHYDIYGFPFIDSIEGGETLSKGQALVELAKKIKFNQGETL